MFHTTTHTTQSWHLPAWSPINSHEGSISIATSNYKQSSMVVKSSMSYGKLIMWINFRYSFKETLKAEKHSNFRTSLYTTYWVVLPSYKAYSIWMETWQRLRHEEVKCRVKLYSHKLQSNVFLYHELDCWNLY